MSRRLLAALVSAAALAAAFAFVLTAGAAGPRARWNTRVLALIPRPGFPALAYVHPNGRIYEGTYDNPAGDTMRSRVFELDGNGTLVRSWTITGQDLSKAHGVQVAISDSRGRLVLLDKSPARVLILDRRTGRQTTYATFPDLPTCPNPLQPGPNCSPAVRDEAPVPDYGAWGRDASLYVTDYNQAVIWRVPPGGGKPVVWLADHRLDGDTFGTTGIVTGRDHRTLFFTQQSSAGLGEPNPTTGKLYSVPIGHGGKPGAIKKLWESQPVDGPDGFAIARSGRFYIALAGSNQIVVVGPDGKEAERFPGEPQTGTNGSPVAFDTPSSAMFLGTRLIVANQAYFDGSPASQAVLDVETRERGVPPYIPRRAGLKPARRR